MGLIYNNLNDLQINSQQNVSFQNIYNIEAKLLSNDLTMIGSGKSPQIWRNRQYNDENAVGYAKGDSVWLNTEDINRFTIAHEDEIISYVQNDQQLRFKFEQLSGQSHKDERLALCQKIIEGDEQTPPLYYLGDITKPVQIRVSLIDDNRSFPTDNKYWKDFFVRPSDRDIQLSMLNIFENRLTEIFNDHNIQYHLSGIYNSKAELEKEYARIDFSNILKKQNFTSHYWYQPVIEGLDCVKFFAQREVFDQCYKWFRVWQSGLIEHGGIVDLNYIDDLDKYEDGVYTVRFNWAYNKGTAPIYDYPPNGFNNFYGHSEVYDSFSSQNIPIQQSNFNQRIRYTIQLTPLNCCSIPFEYSLTDTMSGSPRTCFYSNEKFSFIPISESITKYSYLVRGYSNQNRKF